MGEKGVKGIRGSDTPPCFTGQRGRHSRQNCPKFSRLSSLKFGSPSSPLRFDFGPLLRLSAPVCGLVLRGLPSPPKASSGALYADPSPAPSGAVHRVSSPVPFRAGACCIGHCTLLCTNLCNRQRRQVCRPHAPSSPGRDTTNTTLPLASAPQSCVPVRGRPRSDTSYQTRLCPMTCSSRLPTGVIPAKVRIADAPGHRLQAIEPTNLKPISCHPHQTPLGADFVSTLSGQTRSDTMLRIIPCTRPNRYKICLVRAQSRLHHFEQIVANRRLIISSRTMRQPGRDTAKPGSRPCRQTGN